MFKEQETVNLLKVPLKREAEFLVGQLDWYYTYKLNTYPEGIAVQVTTDQELFEIVLSTETIRAMFEELEAVVGRRAEASDQGLRRRE